MKTAYNAAIVLAGAGILVSGLFVAHAILPIVIGLLLIGGGALRLWRARTGE
jgi:hypothetical protein